MINEVPYSEWFRNLDEEDIPKDTESPETVRVASVERERCLAGVTVDGVYIPGWLYWHLNHWWIFTNSEPDENGHIKRIESLPSLRDNEWIRAATYYRCETFRNPDGRIEKKGYMEVGGRRGGKDLLNSSLLYTPTGEKTIGNCQIGQQIYDDSGKLTTIIGKFPQGVKPVYKMTLIDGRELYCGLEHNWYVWNRKNRKKKKSCPEYQVKTTSELLKKYKHFRNDQVKIGRKRCEEFFYAIPNAQPVQYPKKELPIDPYIFGLWLGDGSNYYSKITTVDQEIQNSIDDFAEVEGLVVTKDGEQTYMITSGKRGGNKQDNLIKNHFYCFLKDNNLFQNKHIPNEYFYSSVEQRMELLRGLMDSDGSCDNTGSIEFSSSIPKLAEDFYKLCRSIGITVTRKERESSYYSHKYNKQIQCKNSFRFVLFTDLPVFKLTRKLEMMRCKSHWQTNVSIIDIQYVFDAETTCIAVDNDSHLFLTDNYTVTHNTEFEASVIGYNATLFELSENVVVGGNDGDLTILKSKIDFGIKRMWVGLKVPKLDKDWRKSSVRLGFKTPGNDDEVWSSIAVRNVADGINTEGPAGLTAKSFVIDECGKFKFGQAFTAAKPSFLTEFGLMAVPIIVGTGGAFEKGDDAERFFYNPDGNGFLAFPDVETGKKTCLFMSGVYRYDCKVMSNLADYLIEQGTIQPGDYPNLKRIPIKVADKVKAMEKIIEDRRVKAMDPDQSEYRKEVMYFPLTPSECFLSEADNFYNAELAQDQKNRLEVEFPGLKIGMFVELVDEGNKIVHKPSSKLPISSYPAGTKEDLDTPVVILEHPVPDPPYGLYVCGVDPYEHEEAKYTTSLGAGYVFKRIYDALGDTFQDMPVAWYVGRPRSKEHWNKTMLNLMKYYNAQTLVENDRMTFIDYVIGQGAANYLMDTPDFIKQIAPTSGPVNTRQKGLTSANEKVRLLMMGNLKQYMEEVVAKVAVKGQEEPEKVLGIKRIYDPMFLEEIIKWNKDGNFDRHVAMCMAITAAKDFDKRQISVSYEDTDPRFKIPTWEDQKQKKHQLLFKSAPVRSYITPKRSIARLMK